jgi:hypothetical protein
VKRAEASGLNGAYPTGGLLGKILARLPLAEIPKFNKTNIIKIGINLGGLIHGYNI